MSTKEYIQIIWLEPKTSRFVKNQIVDCVTKKKVKSGEKIKKNNVVNVRFRKSYYKAKIVATEVDADTSDSEPASKRQKTSDSKPASKQQNLSDSDEDFNIPLVSFVNTPSVHEHMESTEFLTKEKMDLPKHLTQEFIESSQLLAQSPEHLTNANMEIQTPGNIEPTNPVYIDIESSRLITHEDDDNLQSTSFTAQPFQSTAQILSKIPDNDDSLHTEDTHISSSNLSYQSLPSISTIFSLTASQENTLNSLPSLPTPCFAHYSSLDMNFYNGNSSPLPTLVNSRENTREPNFGKTLDNMDHLSGKPFLSESRHEEPLASQSDFIEKQNRVLIENQNNIFDALMKLSTSVSTIQSNMEYLINLIKARSKGTPAKTINEGKAAFTSSVDSLHTKPIVVMSITNSENIRVGNTNIEMSHEEYCSILLKSHQSPPTFAVKLLGYLFAENELYNKNVTGKYEKGKDRQKDKLNPLKLNAIISQIQLQFPSYMDLKENLDKVFVALNGKCRKTTAKIDKTVFASNN